MRVAIGLNPFLVEGIILKIEEKVKDTREF